VQSPANPQSRNRYSYCLNNPLKYSDPSGLITVIVAGTDSKPDEATGYKSWDEFVSYLKSQGEEVKRIIWDEDSMSAGERTDELINFLNGSGLENINLVGFSEGGNVVLDFLASEVGWQ